MAKQAKPKFKIQIIYRDATNGQIVTKAYADKHPNTTTKETRKIPV